MHKAFYAALLLAFAGLPGCCPRRIDFGPRGEVRAADELLALVDAVERGASSITAEGRLRLELQGGQGTVGAIVAAAGPASFVIQASDFFGRPLSVLTSDGERFGLWVEAEAAYYTGPATAANLSRFTRVPITPEDLVALLLGRAPRIAAAAWSLEVDREAGAYRLRGEDGARSQALWVDTLTFRPVRSEVTIPGGGGYRARFGDFREPRAFPRLFALESLSGAPPALLELRVTELALDVDLDPVQFVPEAPEGITPIELDEAGVRRSP